MICSSEPLFDDMYQRFRNYCSKEKPNEYIKSA